MIGIKYSGEKALVNGLDGEWVDLILTARNMGMTVVEVGAFINEHHALSNNEVYVQFVQKRKELNC